jgi:pimeloyl-ACP methyl ester carboxylesterase
MARLASWSGPAPATPGCSRRGCASTCGWSSPTCGTSPTRSSSRPSFRPEQVSAETYADDVNQVVRQALGLGDVVVIGHSIHAINALEYARRYPQHVREVVAVGG